VAWAEHGWFGALAGLLGVCVQTRTSPESLMLQGCFGRKIVLVRKVYQGR